MVSSSFCLLLLAPGMAESRAHSPLACRSLVLAMHRTLPGQGVLAWLQCCEDLLLIPKAVRARAPMSAAIAGPLVKTGGPGTTRA